MTLTDAVIQVRNGDPEAFRFIVRELNPSVRSMLASLVFDYGAVEDLVQETFVAAYENLESYDTDRDLGHWIRGIARNKMRMYLRRYRIHSEAMSHLREAVADRLTAMEPVKSDRFEYLKQCLLELPEKLREIFRAHYFRHERVKDIAACMEKSENAISTLLCRGRKQLRVCVEGKS